MNVPRQRRFPYRPIRPAQFHTGGVVQSSQRIMIQPGTAIVPMDIVKAIQSYGRRNGPGWR
jgi:hypothetical protein